MHQINKPEGEIDAVTGQSTTGHEWDGIQELNTPLPRWWLWTFYATIVFAIGYVVAYPAIPGLHAATRGMLGWSSRGQLDKDLSAQQAERAKLVAELATTPIATLPGKPALMRAAVAGGAAAFKVNCVQCHGIKDEAATAVFEAPGINLAYAPQRLRKGYYDRWMLNPLRLDPETKMPKFSEDYHTTQLTDVLEGKAVPQFDAIWQYLRTIK